MWTCQGLSIGLEDVPGFPRTGRTKGSSLGSSVGREEAAAEVQPHQAAEVHVPGHLCLPVMDFFSH